MNNLRKRLFWQRQKWMKNVDIKNLSTRILNIFAQTKKRTKKIKNK